MSIDDFLGHTPSGGGRSNFLRRWKKRNPPHIDTWMHTGCVPTPNWQHNVPRIYDNKEGDVTVKVVSGSSWNCWEAEDVLKKQRFLDRQTGARVLMPVVCPTCRLVENVRYEYASGTLGFCTPLFEWVGDDPAKKQALTVGGIIGRYGRDDLSIAEKEAMTSAGVNPREAWRESLWAKCNYIFVVVEEGCAKDGVQIASETTQVGQVVKDVIEAQREALGLNEGDPLRTPYAIRWKYNANADLSKKYNAIAMPKIELTPEIDELIHGPAPDLSGVTKHGDVAALRANLESAATSVAKSKLDWDWIFAPAEAKSQTTAEQSKSVQTSVEDVAPKEEPPKKEAKTATKKRSRKKKEVKKPEPKPEPPKEEMEPCDECGEPMAAEAVECVKCGAQYDFSDSDSETAKPADLEF